MPSDTFRGINRLFTTYEKAIVYILNKEMNKVGDNIMSWQPLQVLKTR